MGSEERDLQEVLRIKRRRLSELNKQIARLGYEAPPHLITERDELRDELDKDKQVLEPIIKKELSDDAQAALRQYGVPAAISNAVMLVELGLSNLQKEFQAYREQRNRDSANERNERRERQKQHDYEMHEIRGQVGHITRRQWLELLLIAIIVTYLLTRGLI